MTATRRCWASAGSSVKRMLAPRLSMKTLPALPSLLNTFTCCALKLSFWPKTLNVPALGLIASRVPLCMPGLSNAVHAALLGAGAAAAVAALGMNTPAFEGAVPGRALGAAVDFIGTPGADKEAAGRVTEAALGAVALAAADDAAPVRAPGAALVVAALVAEFAGAETAGAPGAVAGGVADVTVAVIE